MEEICRGFSLKRNIETGIYSGFLKVDIGIFFERLQSKGYEYYLIRSSKKPKPISVPPHETDQDSDGTQGRKPLAVRFLKTRNARYAPPFVFGNTQYFQCAQGGRDGGKQIEDHKNSSKELSCTSTITVKEMIVFCNERYRGAGKLNPEERLKIIEEITASSRSNRTDHICFVKFEVKVNPHHNHEINLSNLRIHTQIKEKISELVQGGVTHVEDLKMHLKEKVKEMFKNVGEMPDEKNTKYYPSNATIYSEMYSTLHKTKGRCVDKKVLSAAVYKWRGEDNSNVFFRPYGEMTNSVVEPFLFCYQSQWQRDLLSQYRHTRCVLESAYKTDKSTLPLYFIYVPVDDNRQKVPVAIFVCMSDSTDNVKEALNIFSGWNPQWKPESFMVDSSKGEVNSVKDIFPRCEILICPSNRERVWLQWSGVPGNLKNSEFLHFMKNLLEMANAPTEKDFNVFMENFRKSELYCSNEKVRNFVEGEWVIIKERWSQCFSSDSYESVITKNRESGCSIHIDGILKKFSGKSLTEVLISLVETFGSGLFLTRNGGISYGDEASATKYAKKTQLDIREICKEIPCLAERCSDLERLEKIKSCLQDAIANIKSYLEPSLASG